MSRRNASCRRAISAFCAATLALFSSSISRAMLNTASRLGTTSRRRKPALRRIFSAGVQSNSGSKVCQYSSSLARRLVNPLVAADQLLQFGQRRDVGLPELGQLLAVPGTTLARDVQQVVAHEDAGEVDVGSQASEVRFDQAVVRAELIELNIDVLRLAGRRERSTGR